MSLEEKFEALFKKKLSQRELGRQLGVTHYNVRTHLNHFKEPATPKSIEAGRESSLLDNVVMQSWRIQRRIQAAEKRADYTTAAKSEAALAKNLELQARLSDIQEHQPSDGVTKAQISSLIGVLVEELHSYPDLQSRIVSRLDSFTDIAAKSNGAASSHSG